MAWRRPPRRPCHRCLSSRPHRRSADERERHLFAAVCAGPQQRRVAAEARGVEVGARGDELKRDVLVAVGAGPHQRGDSAAGVDVCLGTDELERHAFAGVCPRLPACAGPHKRRVAARVRGVDVCTGADEFVHHLREADPAGPHQRRGALPVLALTSAQCGRAARPPSCHRSCRQ